MHFENMHTDLFLKLKISKEITLNFSKIFKNKKLIFRDVEGLLPVTSLKKKHLLPKCHQGTSFSNA